MDFLTSNTSVISLSVNSSILQDIYEFVERSRIQIHLCLVEHELRQKSVSYLTNKLQKQRLINLNRLQEYRKKGVFPKNTYTPNRWVPCFKDKHGVTCAVGYLMECDGNIQEVNTISNYSMHIRIQDVKGGPVKHWLNKSGITQSEAALIQPSYGPCGLSGTNCGPVTKFFAFYPYAYWIIGSGYLLVSEIILFFVSRWAAKSFISALVIWLLLSVGNIALVLLLLSHSGYSFKYY